MEKQNTNLKLSLLNDTYGNLLTEKQRILFKEYYDLDCSLAELAEEWGITRQAVRDSIKKSEEALNFFEKTLKVLEKREQINQLLNEAQGVLKNDNVKVTGLLEKITVILEDN